MRQAFALERQYGYDDEQLCRASAALCKALSRVPSGPVEAVTPLLQALDALDARAIAAGEPHAPSGSPHLGFLTRELYGLARKLSCTTEPHGGAHARLDDLRAADRAYERLAQLAKTHKPLRIGTQTELILTSEECFYQLAVAAERAGMALMRSGLARDQEAACFFLQRAARKLKLAGAYEHDPRVAEVRSLLSTAEAQLRDTQQQPALMPQQGGPKADAPGSAAASASVLPESCLVQ